MTFTGAIRAGIFQNSFLFFFSFISKVVGKWGFWKEITIRKIPNDRMSRVRAKSYVYRSVDWLTGHLISFSISVCVNTCVATAFEKTYWLNNGPLEIVGYHISLNNTSISRYENRGLVSGPGHLVRMQFFDNLSCKSELCNSPISLVWHYKWLNSWLVSSSFFSVCLLLFTSSDNCFLLVYLFKSKP